MEQVRPQKHRLLSRFLAPPTWSDDETLREAVGGKTVLVTGASFGIGRALSLRLGRVGATVLMLARSEETLLQLKLEIETSGGQAHCYPIDLRDTESIDEVAAKISEDHPSLYAVVHNAGKSIRRSLHKSLDRPHDFERCMAVNYLGPVRLQLALLRNMIALGDSHIINVSSVSVRLPAAAHWAAYHCSKTAFDLWLAAALPELVGKGVTGTTVYFGLVHTRMSAPTEAYRSMPGQTAEQAASVICRALVLRPRAIQPWWLGPASAVMLPCHRLSEWIQGKVLG